MRLAAGMVAGMVLAASSASIFAVPPGGVDAATSAEVNFAFERPGVPVPQFVLRVHEDGSGSYQAEEMEGPGDGGLVHYAASKHIDRTMNLTPSMAAKIFAMARGLDRFKMDCESKKKNIAKTGKKTLSYAGSDGSGSCVYNFSDSKEVMALNDMFLAIANTMDEGRRLEFLHRYDRLGLDAEMSSLQEQAKTGRALELGTIAPVLTSIARDTALMERVRMSAAKLLEQSTVDKI
jgi:hypothetical protein